MIARLQAIRPGTGDLAFPGIHGRRRITVWTRVEAIAHQGRIEVLQSFRGQTIRVKSDILTHVGVIAQEIGDGDEAGGTRLQRREGLEEKERFEGRVSRQRRHPPLPVRPATGGGEFGDWGHDGRVIFLGSSSKKPCAALQTSNQGEQTKLNAPATVEMRRQS